MRAGMLVPATAMNNLHRHISALARSQNIMAHVTNNTTSRRRAADAGISARKHLTARHGAAPQQPASTRTIYDADERHGPYRAAATRGAAACDARLFRYARWQRNMRHATGVRRCLVAEDGICYNNRVSST